MPRQLSAQNLLLQSQLHEERRKRRYEQAWLKKHAPEAYRQLQQASCRNDEQYRLNQLRQMSEDLSKTFKM